MVEQWRHSLVLCCCSGHHDDGVRGSQPTQVEFGRAVLLVAWSGAKPHEKIKAGLPILPRLRLLCLQNSSAVLLRFFQEHMRRNNVTVLERLAGAYLGFLPSKNRATNAAW